MVEVYRELTPDFLNDIDGDARKQAFFTRGLFRRVSQLPNANQLILLIFAFREKGYCPNPSEAEYLANLSAAPFVDATSLPAVIPTDVDSFLAYAKSFLDAMESANGVAVLGYLPTFARRDLLKVIDFYIKRDIKDLIIEFNGHHAGILYPTVRLAASRLQAASGKNFLIHGLNVGPGAFRRKVDAGPARDFLALVSGVDSMGPKHIRRKMPPEVWERLAAESGKARRLFARRDYGYYQSGVFPRRVNSEREEGAIRLSSVLKNPTPESVHLFNAERQALETGMVRMKLADESLLDYVRSKTRIREDIDKITQTRRLEDYTESKGR